ncbi:MAG: putative zinc-binding metallopeptidase [Candidatus Omnitrophota bacterium]
MRDISHGLIEMTSAALQKKKINPASVSEEMLLSTRICDLDVKIPGSWLEGCISELNKELDDKGIRFKPTCYLADEWLTPEDEITIGIPFYLADDALIKLEKKMMLEAEGETKNWCMKLLHHETGHTINHGYKLSKSRKWQKVFGSPHAEYGDTYRFRPYSRNFVRHLEDYYAQYHPDEDFAETFAVWLTPELDWNQQYKGWKALSKLKFVEQLIQTFKDKDPLVTRANKFWQASRSRMTLANYYKKKKQFSAEAFPDFHDTNLKRIFVEKNEETKDFVPAHDIIKRNKSAILKSVAAWAGEKKYIINDLLKNIEHRCQELKLVSPDTEVTAMTRISTYVTVLVMNYRYTGKFRGKTK